MYLKFRIFTLFAVSLYSVLKISRDDVGPIIWAWLFMEWRTWTENTSNRAANVTTGYSQYKSRVCHRKYEEKTTISINNRSMYNYRPRVEPFDVRSVRTLMLLEPFIHCSEVHQGMYRWFEDPTPGGILWSKHSGSFTTPSMPLMYTWPSVCVPRPWTLRWRRSYANSVFTNQHGPLVNMCVFRWLYTG